MADRTWRTIGRVFVVWGLVVATASAAVGLPFAAACGAICTVCGAGILWELRP